ncbi:MAG: N-acetyltransferase [Anaerolineales bacterium]|nr:N-acetyltransferase [Anaerolineales bacterium]
MNKIKIRAEREGDIEAVHRVNALAFRQENEAQIVDKLRARGVPLISLVAVLDEQVVGHALFSPVTVVGEAPTLSKVEETVISSIALGPIGVLPEYQKQGIGGMLIRAGLEACRDAGHGAVFVLGHSKYYPRFGFQPTKPHGIICEFPAPPEAFMVVELVPGTLANLQGTVTYQPEFQGS